MKHILFYTAIALFMFTSCQHDEPTVKRRGERQIYVLTYEGQIYDLMGDMIMQLMASAG